MISAVVPCHVTNRPAGERTPAPAGHARGVGGLPIAIVAATSFGSTSVFRVSRKAVALFSAFTRSSTRSAALPA